MIRTYYKLNNIKVGYVGHDGSSNVYLSQHDITTSVKTQEFILITKWHCLPKVVWKIEHFLIVCLILHEYKLQSTGFFFFFPSSS